MKKYGINNYFFLDSSIPMIVKLKRKIGIRYSEYEAFETVKNFINDIEWVWIDCFNKFPLTKE